MLLNSFRLSIKAEAFCYIIPYPHIVSS